MDKRRRSSIALKRRSFDGADSTLVTYSTILSTLEESFEKVAGDILGNDDDGQQINELKKRKILDVQKTAKHLSRLTHVSEIDPDDPTQSDCSSYVNKLTQEVEQWKSMVEELKEEIANSEKSPLNLENMPAPEIENMSKKNKLILQKRLRIDDLRLSLDENDMNSMEQIILCAEKLKDFINENKRYMTHKTKLLGNRYIYNYKEVLSDIF